MPAPPVHRVILLHPAAPPKPAVGAECNGCGACCATDPCPLGILLSRRRTGACVALDWDESRQRYLCGAVADPRRHLPWLPAALSRALALRWISARRGCDADIEVASPAG